MRPLLGLLLLLALCLGIVACGDSGGRPAKASAATTSTSSSHERDRDNDGDHNDDDARVLDFGHAADAIERSSLIGLVKHYFTAAAAEDGKHACELLVPLLVELVVEEDGRSPMLRGRTCAVVVSKLFALHHRMLLEKNAALQVLEVRVKGDRGLVVLNFPEIPEARQFGGRRIGGSWKLDELLDGIIE
jgi:hypothetical protein